MGNVDAGSITLEGFASGQILLYVTGNVSFGNNLIFPGRIHARGSVRFGVNALVTGGVYGGALVEGNSATISYTRSGREHRLGSLLANGDWFKSTFELAPGDYYFNGDFNLAVQTVIRKLPGSTGKVRIFVNGKIDISFAAKFEGFSAGELLMYSTGDVSISSQTDMPVFIYSAQDVKINFSQNARFKGGIVGRNVFVGQNSIIEYVVPADLEPLCTDQLPVSSVHHYELSYASQALTCQPHRVELKACVDEACSGTYSAGQSSVTLSPAGWVGGSTVSFIGNKEVSLAIRSPGSVTLGIANPLPVASGSPALRCRINGVLSNQCALTFADSGLLVSVPPLIAGKPDTLTISAVRRATKARPVSRRSPT